MSKLFKFKKNAKSQTSSTPSTSLASSEKPYPTSETTSVEDVRNWLDNLIKEVNCRTDHIIKIYDVPQDMRSRLERDIQDLLILQREAAASFQEVQRVKTQLTALATSIGEWKSKLRLIKIKESEELEDVVKHSFHPMYEKWIQVKYSRQVSVVEEFLKEIKMKQAAIESLAFLANRKLYKLNEGSRYGPTRRNKKSLRDILESPEDADDERETDSEDMQSSGLLSILFQTNDK